MNSLRLIYILKSEFVFSIIFYSISIFVEFLISFFYPNKNIDLLSNIIYSIYISSYASILLSISKKVINRFDDKKYISKYNSLINSLYLLIIHIIISNVYLYFDNNISIINSNYIFLTILVAFIVYSNIKFYKINYEKK